MEKMRVILKILIHLLVSPLAIIFILGYWFGSFFFGRERAFRDMSQCVALIPTIFGEYARRVFFKAVLPYSTWDVCISFGTLLTHPETTLGHRTYIGPYCILGNVEIGNDVMLASAVSVANGVNQHGIQRIDIPMNIQPGIFPRIRIGNDVWLGERSVILADIGDHSVVGAASLVLDPVPEYVITCGVPSRTLKKRGEMLNVDEERNEVRIGIEETVK